MHSPDRTESPELCQNSWQSTGIRPPREIFFCKISGSRHHKWENNGNLPVPTGEPGQLLVFLYYQILISYRQKEPEKQSLVFPSASMLERPRSLP